MANQQHNETSPKQPSTESLKGFASFAILDLETNTLPWTNGFRVSITEMSIYGIAAKCLQGENNKIAASGEIGEEPPPVVIPKNPRVLHKLTMLFNPRARIHPEAERITGLDNYMLEHESPFNENAANTLIGFLEHLPKPVCMVAHNGWFFDFPIVKQILDKLQKKLPIGTYCLDSLNAFWEIDQQRKEKALEILLSQSSNESLVENDDEIHSSLDALSQNSTIDWQALNEKTPKRRVSSEATKSRKRQLLASGIVEDPNEECPMKRPSFAVSAKSKRSLFPTPSPAKPKHLTKRFPPKEVYKLDSMFERIFGNKFEAHQAEGDVEALCKLMHHYGDDFLEYAEQHAVPFEQIIHLAQMEKR